MLQIARLSPKLLGESTPLVESFLRSQLHPSGGFMDRAGEPDLGCIVENLRVQWALFESRHLRSVTQLRAGLEGLEHEPRAEFADRLLREHGALADEHD
jgi:hypothetical protein